MLFPVDLNFLNWPEHSRAWCNTASQQMHFTSSNVASSVYTVSVAKEASKQKQLDGQMTLEKLPSFRHQISGFCVWQFLLHCKTDDLTFTLTSCHVWKTNKAGFDVLSSAFLFSFVTQLSLSVLEWTTEWNTDCFPRETVWKCAPVSFSYLNNTVSLPSLWWPEFHSAFRCRLTVNRPYESALWCLYLVLPELCFLSEWMNNSES